MRKFTESINNDIFSDEDLLNDILLEYSDEGFKWSKLYKHYKVYNDGDGEWLMPVSTFESRKSNAFYGHETEDVFDKSQSYFPTDAVRAYQVEFAEVYEDILANDKQRGYNIRHLQIPPKKLYKFFDITKEIQERFESMGYIFMLSVHQNAEFDLLISEKY